MSAALEGRYRRLVALMPWEHRRRYEDEMLGVLLAGAAEGQRWPRPAEVADVALAAVRQRLRRGTVGFADPWWGTALATLGLYLAVV